MKNFVETAQPLTTPGCFVVGCNYWASHAGTGMWSEWRAEVVSEDLQQLAEAGLQVLRVFPLWPDFQPLTLLRGGHGRPEEFRHGEEPLPETAAGQAGLSAAALAHFAEFADLAEQYKLQLVVGLITGWMSGRLFVPPALEGRNPLTDPVSLQWQVRFVREFVRRFKDHPAITAWDLGNECNCMGPATREEAWVWTAAIVNAIRAEDTSRPVVSGMHSLAPGREAVWTMQDQGELTDLLTTHPYPYFTPYCDQDPVNTIRPILHSTVESRWYADIGGKPCLVEEIGTLGPMIASEQIAADYLRSVLFSAWAHECHGLLWWCAFDQLGLERAPYDWYAFERELGLIRGDKMGKPVLAELGKFRAVVKKVGSASVPASQSSLPGESINGLAGTLALPPRVTEAVCICSEGQDQWAAAYSAFILAKQAGFDLEFQYSDQPLKEARLYLLPCISGGRVLPRRRWLELLARVEAGATLYISHQDGMLTPINAPLGIEIQTRERRVGNSTATFVLPTPPAPLPAREGGERFALPVGGPIKLTVAPTSAEVLGREADGNPVLTRARYGKGQIYFLTYPLEIELTKQPGAFHMPEAPACWQLYRAIAEPFLAGRVVRKHHPLLGVTEHPLDDGRRVVIFINYSPTGLDAEFALAAGWQVSEQLYGTPVVCGGVLTVLLSANEAVVIVVEKG